MEEGWVVETLLDYHRVFLDEILDILLDDGISRQCFTLGTIVLRENKLREAVTNILTTHFLGHVISNEGIFMDLVKVETIMEGLG